MKDLLIYDLKVVALIAVFYLLYRLLLHRSTLHRLNRMVLLGSLVLSLALPLCVITRQLMSVLKTPVWAVQPWSMPLQRCRLLQTV